MTPEDKQILLDAARSIGHLDPRVSEGEWLERRFGLTCAVHFAETDWQSEGGYFNPLEDDGDAFRMAVKMGVSVKHLPIFQDDKHSVVAMKMATPAKDSIIEALPYNDDPYAATRLAICRAVALIMRAK